VALLARFGRATALGLVAACAAAWAVACVRIVGLEGARADTLPFAGLALALVVLACAVARLLLRRWEGQPWAKLGALSFIAGAVALPWSPG
jgi:drug/metabolite transporter (DMT)-like permease